MKQIYTNAKICSCGEMISGSLVVENGLIDSIIPQGGVLPQGAVKDVGGVYIMPVFIDSHIHGFGGHGTDIFDPKEMLYMSEFLAKAGVGGFMPTIYPNTPDIMLKNIKALTPLIGQEKGAKIIGLHLEGPFISPKKLGVMKPEAAAKPDLDLMQVLYEAAEGKIAAVTLAPELEGIEKIVKFCLDKGIVAQAGHTDASYSQMLAAAEMGIHHATHLFNAMRGLAHRDPGAAGGVILNDKFSFEIIADGVHVCPEIVNMVLRLKKPESVVLVSDALSPAGTEGGLANGEEVILSGGVFRRKADNVVAGSALSMLKGVENLSKWGLTLEQASAAASDNPARLHKLDFGILASGRPAYFNIIDNNFKLLETVR